MRTIARSPLRGTLGFFLKGIPVVFVKTQCLFESGTSPNKYLEFVAEHPAGEMKDPHLSREQCFAYQHTATTIHEIRHFHDALLCKPLFEVFLLQNKITWYMMQLAGHFPHSSQLPVDIHDPVYSSVAILKLFKGLINECDELTFLRQERLWDTCSLNGHAITLEHLLEANATAAELLHLYSMHGVNAMKDYYDTIVVNAEDKYNRLIQEFSRLYDGLFPGLAACYLALGYSLFSSHTPTEHFCSLFSRLQQNRKLIYAEGDRWLSHPFPNEDEVAREIAATALMNAETGVAIRSFGNPETPFMDELANFHTSIYASRQQLIRKYVGEFRYRSDLYIEHMEELPIPPILFYPLDSDSSAQIAPAILESDLRKRGIPYYVLAAHDDGKDKIVLAGMTALSTGRPCVGFDVADMHLMNQFFYAALFRGLYSVYSPPLDDVYLRLLTTVVKEGRDALT
jgi:hypothetical protein